MRLGPRGTGSDPRDGKGERIRETERAERDRRPSRESARGRGGMPSGVKYSATCRISPLRISGAENGGRARAFNRFGSFVFFGTRNRARGALVELSKEAAPTFIA